MAGQKGGKGRVSGKTVLKYVIKVFLVVFFARVCYNIINNTKGDRSALFRFG